MYIYYSDLIIEWMEIACIYTSFLTPLPTQNIPPYSDKVSRANYYPIDNKTTLRNYAKKTVIRG